MYLTDSCLDDRDGHDQRGGHHVAEGEGDEEKVEHVLKLALVGDGEADQDIATYRHDDDDEQKHGGPVV